MERYGTPGEGHSVSEAFWPWLIKAFAMPALLATPARAAGGAALPTSRLNRSAREKLILLLGGSGLRQDDAERSRFGDGHGLADLLRRRRGDVSLAPDGVLYPRNAADVQGLLTLCAELDVAICIGSAGTDVSRSHARPTLALDLSGLDRILARDYLSGLVEVEAGIGGAELERQLKAQGLTLGTTFETSLGGWIASAETMPAPVQSLTVATPRGMLQLDKGLHHLMAGSRGRLGVITSARLRVRPQPEDGLCCAYLFSDFAAGLTVLREVVRRGLPHDRLLLLDDGATRLERALTRHNWNRAERFYDVWRALRGFNTGAARLIVNFSGNEAQRKLARKNFEALARRLGHFSLGAATLGPAHPRDALLDRGVGIDLLQFSASWSELPLLYARLRSGLTQAMRAHPALPGAQGLVLTQISDARSDGASVTVTWLFARKLEDEVAQATAIRQAALAASGIGTRPGLERDMLDAIKRSLDPKNILAPEG
ncbi:MAG TPA: FAD-binding oxidoreductase [Rhizomicrobium sp.]|jgi:alkyldihydroxyacetonephosphate synthase